MSDILHALGLDVGADRLFLVEPPDAVLAEAGHMTPRPTIASSVDTARPAQRMVWWPQPEELNAATLGRLRWLLAASGGLLWVVVEAETGLAVDVVVATLAAAGFTVEGLSGAPVEAVCVRAT